MGYGSRSVALSYLSVLDAAKKECKPESSWGSRGLRVSLCTRGLQWPIL